MNTAFWRKSKIIEEGLGAFDLEGELGAKADAMLLPIAHDFEELDEEGLEGKRESLTHWLGWKLKERIAGVETQLQGLAEALASVSISGRASRWLQKHLGDAEVLHDRIDKTGGDQYGAL